MEVPRPCCVGRLRVPAFPAAKRWVDLRTRAAGGAKSLIGASRFIWLGQDFRIVLVERVSSGPHLPTQAAEQRAQDRRSKACRPLCATDSPTCVDEFLRGPSKESQVQSASASRTGDPPDAFAFERDFQQPRIDLLVVARDALLALFLAALSHHPAPWAVHHFHLHNFFHFPNFHATP